MKATIDRKQIKPPDSTPEFTWGAWSACLRWALTTPEIRSRFERDTGHSPWPEARSPIEKMIDEACGRDYEYLAAFAKWHDENIWGL